MRTTVGLLVAGFFLVSSADAKVLYVDRARGDDATSYAANGPTTPWATIGRAAWGSANRSALNPNEAARAGDVVHVAAGTYPGVGRNTNYDVTYNPVNEGTRGAPIVFVADGSVNLTYIAGSFGPLIGADSRDYITWDGFTIDELTATIPANNASTTVMVQYSVGATIQNCILTGKWDGSSSINHSAIWLQSNGPNSGITLRNNRLSRFRSARGHDGCGVMIYGTGGVIIEHNEIDDAGSGVWLKGPSELPWVTPGQYDIRYNLVYNVEVGIGVHASPNAAQAPVRVYQNIVRDSDVAFKIHTFDQGTIDPRNVRFVNNTADNLRYFGLQVTEALVANAGHLFWNNIITNCPSYSAITFDRYGTGSSLVESRLDLEHNLYYQFGAFARVGPTDYSFAGWRTAFSQDSASPASLNVDPLFVNAAGNDFRLATGSPARAGGIDLLDLNNNGATSDPIPIGAYVTGNEVIGRTTRTSGSDSLPPAAPTGVRVIR